MNFKVCRNEVGDRGATNIYLIIFVIVFLISSVTVYSLYNTSFKAEKKRMARNESNLVEIQKETIHMDFDSIVSGLLLFADHTSNRMEAGELVALSEDYLDYSRRMGLYDQVRYMDNKGMEVIRVNFNEGSPSVVPEDKLQNKGNRYYFKDLFVLNKDEVFVSPLDLNIEGGKIERPTTIKANDSTFKNIWRPETEGKYAKPMIRFGIPVFTKDGEKKGVLIFNYFGNMLLNRFDNISHNSAGQVLMANKDGYWLKGSSYDKEWGFMQEHDYSKDSNLKRDFPEASKTIFTEEEGQFSTEKGLFTFNTIRPIKQGMLSSSGSGKAFEDSEKNLAAEEYIWKVISYVPASTFSSVGRKILVRLLALYALFMAALGGGVFYFAKANSSPKG